MLQLHLVLPQYMYYIPTHNVRIPCKSNYIMIQLQTKNQSNISNKTIWESKMLKD
jgi:hypothetical protein